MSLVERLEKMAKEQDRKVWTSVPHGYNSAAADLRDLLDEARKELVRATQIPADRIRNG